MKSLCIKILFILFHRDRFDYFKNKNLKKQNMRLSILETQQWKRKEENRLHPNPAGNWPIDLSFDWY